MRSGTALDVGRADDAVTGVTPPCAQHVATHERRERHRRLSATEREQLVSGYESGSTINDVARQLGLNRSSATAALNRAGVPRHQRGLTESDIDQAVAQYTAGWSLARVGAQQGVAARTVRSALLRRGVNMRDTHGQER
jgi:transposase-like protein